MLRINDATFRVIGTCQSIRDRADIHYQIALIISEDLSLSDSRCPVFDLHKGYLVIPFHLCSIFFFSAPLYSFFPPFIDSPFLPLEPGAGYRMVKLQTFVVGSINSARTSSRVAAMRFEDFQRRVLIASVMERRSGGRRRFREIQRSTSLSVSLIR